MANLDLVVLTGSRQPGHITANYCSFCLGTVLCLVQLPGIHAFLFILIFLVQVLGLKKLRLILSFDFMSATVKRVLMILCAGWGIYASWWL